MQCEMEGENVMKAISELDRMVSEERERWLKSRGEAGGSFAEFTAHISTLIRTDDEWRAAAIQKYAEKLVAAYKAGRLPKRMRKPRPIKGGGETQVHVDFATVGDFISHADLLQKRAKIRAERAEADAAMMAAETARERRRQPGRLFARHSRPGVARQRNTAMTTPPAPTRRAGSPRIGRLERSL
jgi:hypothetical protein